MIEVKNLDYIYSKTNKKVIHNVNFQVEKGEIFGFLGPSGSGKTTIQRIIIGLLRGYEGEVKVFNKERREWTRDFFEKIGVAFDFPNLYLKLTAKENLELISQYYKNKNNNIDYLLDKVNLLHFADEKIENFSKGMKMRVNFIRAIMHEPEIVFLDEPTAGLDPINAKIIKEIILSLKSEGKTIFLTTHNMLIAEQLCDKVAFLVDGKIPIIDKPKNLKVKYSKKLVKVEYEQRDSIASRNFDFSTLGSNVDFLNILKSNKLKTIHSQEATLEEVFIDITGKKLS